MRIPLLVALFALSVVANARAANSCDRAGLIEKLSAAPQLDSAPAISKQQGVQVSRFFLSGSSIAIDGFKYDALVDSIAGQAWVVQYSGIAGSVQWFGTVTVEPEKVATITCAYDIWQWQEVQTYMQDENQEARSLALRLGGVKISRQRFPDGLERDVFRLPPTTAA